MENNLVIDDIDIYEVKEDWSLQLIDKRDKKTDETGVVVDSNQPMMIVVTYSLFGKIATVESADKLPPLPKHIKDKYVVDIDEENNRKLHAITPELYAKSLVDAAWIVTFPEDGSWIRMIEMEGECIKTVYACCRNGNVYVSTVKQVGGLDHALVSSMDLVIHVNTSTIVGPGDAPKVVYATIPVEPWNSESVVFKGPFASMTQSHIDIT